jgi:hypothetical protein
MLIGTAMHESWNCQNKQEIKGQIVDKRLFHFNLPG